MKDLHLKYHRETGTSHEIEVFGRGVIPTEEYISWLEDLAEKYLKQKEVNAEANKVMARMGRIKLCFESLKSNINAIDSNDVEAYEIIQIADDCDDLESEIYD